MTARNMSSDDYQVHDVYRYNRKSYKKNTRRSSQQNDIMPHDEMNIENDRSPSDYIRMDLPGCSCDVDPEGDVANILHKKCPIITLAQQQLHRLRLLDETEKILCENTRCCRSIYDFLFICREVLTSQNKCICALLILLVMAFAFGVLIGAASCGTYLGRFSSPIMSCLDNFFAFEPTYPIMQEYQGIV